MSGLDKLSREELVALVERLDRTVRALQAEAGELRAAVASQVEKIARLEEEVARGSLFPAVLFLRRA